ncbi:MAG: RNA 2',3'-cyclic phosphodiesterase [Gemmatimonadales bacterium]
MRLFVAVPLPALALDQASSALRSLRKHEWPVRWVRDDGLHITLKFYGEVTADRAAAIEEVLRHAAAGIRRLTLGLGCGGVFPNAQRPRVLHLQVQSSPDLELLQDRLERASAELGFAPEGRPFVPHITLGRVREGHRLPADAMRRLEGVPAVASFEADRVVLFESRLAPDGPVYHARAAELLA